MRTIVLLFLINCFFLQNACKNESKTLIINAKDLVFEKDENEVVLAFLNGKLFSGQAISYFKSGKKFTKKSYNLGKEEGEWVIWHQNGNKMKNGRLEGGKKIGIFNEWYKSGQKKYEQPHQAGL